MADKKISELNSITSAGLASDDVVPVVDTSTPETKKISISELDDRYIQVPSDLINDLGSDASTIWSASKITSVTGTHTVAQFTPQAAPVWAEGKLYYDSTYKALVYYNEEADVSIGVGRCLLVRVKNDTGSTVAKGKAVYMSGAYGDLPRIVLADASDPTKSINGIAIARHDIENATIGYVCLIGLVGNIDTSAWTAGTPLYLSAVTPGGLVSTRPSYPNQSVRAALVVKQDAAIGTIYVYPETETLANFTAKSVYFADGGIPAQDLNFTFDSATDILSVPTVRGGNGSASAPTFAVGETNTGLYLGAAARLNFAVGGSERMFLTSTILKLNGPQINTFDGTAGAPIYSFVNKQSSGLLRDGTADSVKISNNGTIKQEWSDTAVKMGVVGTASFDVNNDGVGIGYQSYGDMYFYNASTPSTITVTSAGTYYPFTAFTSGVVKGAGYVTYNNDDTNGDYLEVGANGAGIYKVTIGASFTGSNTQTIHGEVFVNSVGVDKISFRKGLGTSSPVANAVATGLLSLAASDAIRVKFTSTVNGATIDVSQLIIDIHRVSK